MDHRPRPFFEFTAPPGGAMKDDAYSDGPPSYSESIQIQKQPSRILDDHQHSPDLAHSLLTNDIIPHIQTAISSGIPSCTLVIVPSNAASLQPPVDLDSKAPPKGFSGEKIVGFPSTEDLKMIRLVNPGDTYEYWQRLASKQSLADSVHAYLVQEGYYFQKDLVADKPFERLTGIAPKLRAGWMTVNEERLRDREASINVVMQEVCLRVEDEMGLYETKKGNALVVRVKLGRGDSALVWN